MLDTHWAWNSGAPYPLVGTKGGMEYGHPPTAIFMVPVKVREKSSRPRNDLIVVYTP